MPLAILRPETAVTLIESTKKKAAFLRQAAIDLGLGNVTVVDVRAEDAGRGELRESFDIVVARAVAALDWLAEWCLPLVKKGGKALAMKGEKAAVEIPLAAKAVQLMGGGAPIVHPVALPGSEHRVVVEIRKLGRTDRRYPRAATEAKGNPIR